MYRSYRFVVASLRLLAFILAAALLTGALGLQARCRTSPFNEPTRMRAVCLSSLRMQT